MTAVFKRKLACKSLLRTVVRPQTVLHASLPLEAKQRPVRARHLHDLKHLGNRRRPTLAERVSIGRMAPQRRNVRVRHARVLTFDLDRGGFLGGHHQLVRSQTLRLVPHVHGDARLPPEAEVRLGAGAGHDRFLPRSGRRGAALAEVGRIGVAPQRVDLLVRLAGRSDAAFAALGQGRSGEGEQG